MNLEKEWDDVESFIHDLRSALDFEAKTIRETELDQIGGYREAELKFQSDSAATEISQVFVDRLGRVILPVKDCFQELEYVTFLDAGNGSPAKEQKVLRLEPRFKDQKMVAYVAYLEA